MKKNMIKEIEISPEKEERCGFIVSETQKKIWNIQLQLLYRVLEVCKKHQIRIFAYAGTLLGAVRHRGYIPWDDDVDVALFREDFEKLCSVAEKEFQEPFFFQTGLTDRKRFCGYARLRYSLSTAIIKGDETKDYNNGIYIDIFVLDGYIGEGAKLDRQLRNRSLYEMIMLSYQSDRPRVDNRVKDLLFGVLCKAAHLIRYEKWYQLYQNNLARYSRETDRFSMITHRKELLTKYHCRKKDFDELILVPFETFMIPVPRNYDSVLKEIYGDYMTYPPAEERGEWHSGFITYDPDTPYKEYFERLQKQ